MVVLVAVFGGTIFLRMLSVLLVLPQLLHLLTAATTAVSGIAIITTNSTTATFAVVVPIFYKVVRDTCNGQQFLFCQRTMIQLEGIDGMITKTR